MAARRGPGTGDGLSVYSYARAIAAFGGTILAMVGVVQFVEGLSAVALDGEFSAPRNYLFDFSLTGWGWFHMVIGVVAFAIGIAIVFGRIWGYGLGIAVAAISALGSFLFLPYYPLWGVVILAGDLVIIWALYQAMVPPERRPPL